MSWDIWRKAFKKKPAGCFRRTPKRGNVVEK